jgi:hypothetical protein
MSVKKLFAAATIVAILASTACADVTAPTQQQNGFCAVTGSGQTCD